MTRPAAHIAAVRRVLAGTPPPYSIGFTFSSTNDASSAENPYFEKSWVSIAEAGKGVRDIF